MARFWSQVQEWLLSHNVCVQMDLQTVLLGDLKNHNQSLGNIYILLSKVFIFRALSVEMVQLERFKTLVRHHSKIEGCIVKGNS